jgi:hypothetical protein
VARLAFDLGLGWSVLGRRLFGIRWPVLVGDSQSRGGVESRSDVVKVGREQTRVGFHDETPLAMPSLAIVSIAAGIEECGIAAAIASTSSSVNFLSAHSSSCERYKMT